MMNVWCFELQIRHNLLLKQSMLCTSAVETKFLFDSISLRSSALLLTRTDQLYDLVCHSKYVYRGAGGDFAHLFENTFPFLFLIII